MDDRRFDDLTRRFATGRSRRSVLKGLIAGGAAIAAARAGSSVAANGHKVDVCHWDNDAGGYIWLAISENAWTGGHQGQHGNDYLRGGGCCADQECASGSTCDGRTCVPIVTTTTEAPTTTTGGPCPSYTTRSESTGECVSPCASNPCSNCPRDRFVQCLATLDGHHICDMAPFGVSNSGNCPVAGCPQPGYFTCYQHADGTYQCLNSGTQC